MRLAVYAGVSVTLAAGVVLKALHQRANFYSACVYLSQSSANLMILTNLCLLIVGFLLFGLQRVLYGPLRPIETEQLYEKAWFAITETCLAMTIFRGELGGWFLVMFVCLLVGKVWGWIGEGRVEILEQQPPANPRLFHTRLAVSLLLSVTFSSSMLEYCVKTVLRQARPDMMVMFGFEFAVLTILSCSTAARYAISLGEIYITRKQRRIKMEERRLELRAAREQTLRQYESGQAPTNLPNEDDIDEMELDVPGWEEKGRWIFYLELITDFFKLVVYISFFAILFTFYGLPIHILRDVVLTMRSFGKRVVDFIRYRNATRDMNRRYADATAEEIAREDVCIICREEMRPWQPPPAAPAGGVPGPRHTGVVSERLRPKKLPCGHILHFACLRSWLERQQNCPTCRRPVTTGGATRLYPGGVDIQDAGNAAAAAPQQQIPGAHQAAGPNAQPGEPRPRAWILNFGPVRIGFGAGRGDLFQNLAQQIHNGHPQAPQGPNPNVPPGGPQQIGFGFGFGRHPVQQNQQNTQFNHQSVHAQLQQLEQQITQEINSLRATADQMQLVRLLQGELVRLRAANTNSAVPVGATLPIHPTFPSGPAAPSAPIPSQVSSSVTQRQFTSNPQIPALGSGDNRLPEGLTLPPGWMLLPLQRVDQLGQQAGHQIVQSSSTNTSFPPNTPLPNVLSPHLFGPTTNHTQEAGTQSRVNGTVHDFTSTANTRPEPTPTSLTPSSSSPAQNEGQLNEEGDFIVSRSIAPEGPISPEPGRQTEITSGGPADQPLTGASTKVSPESSGEGVPRDRADNAPAGALDHRSSKGKARAATVEDYIDDES